MVIHLFPTSDHYRDAQLCTTYKTHKKQEVKAAPAHPPASAQ